LVKIQAKIVILELDILALIYFVYLRYSIWLKR